MTDAVAVALIVGVPAFLTSAAGAIVTVAGLRRSNANGKQLEVASIKQDAIHVAVNSNMAAAVAEIKEAKTEIAALRTAAIADIEKQVVDLKAERAAAHDREDNRPRRR